MVRPDPRGSAAAAQCALSERRVVLSGCSGGGKSTLLAELARRGHAVVEEPGRRIVRHELATDGDALPWRDLAAFARRALAMARTDHAGAVTNPGWTFFDRGLVDAAAALEHATGQAATALLRAEDRYHRHVFLTPPWREIHVADDERRHGWDDAVAEYDRLATVYERLGYRTCILARTSVAARADLVLATLAEDADGTADESR